MTVDDLIVMLDAMESLDDRPPIRDGLGDIAIASEGANARIAELEAALTDAEDRYTKTAARNWELMQSVTGEPKEEIQEETPEPSIDELFA